MRNPSAGFGSLVALLDTELVWLTLALIGVLFLGALAVIWAGRWRKGFSQNQETDRDQFLRSLLDQGLLDQEEFDRLQGRREEGPGPSTPDRDLPRDAG